MKIVANRSALHAAFQHAGSIITSTIARPIYQNVKMEAKAGKVCLSATDLEVGITLNVDQVQVEEEGEVLLPELRVSRILGTTPDETISLVGDESAVTIESSDSKFRVVAEDPSDFADVPQMTEGSVIEIDRDVLHYMVRHVAFATAEERGRYALNGVLLVVAEDGGFEMVAADGARLARVRKKASNPDKKPVDCIVMKKGIEQLARLAMLSEEPIKVQITENQLLAANSAGRLCCQLVEGQFPNYLEVIPKDCKIKVELPSRALLNALTRAALLTSEQTRAVDFTFSDGILVLASQSPDLGEAEVRLPVDYKGEQVQIAFNPEYVTDMLKVVERESVKMEFNDRRSPCVMHSGVDYVYVVSPVVREDKEA